MTTHHRTVLHKIESHTFIFYKVTRGFSAFVPFSEAHFMNTPFITEMGVWEGISFENLFTFSPDLLDNPSSQPEHLKESLEKLTKCLERFRSTPWLLAGDDDDGKTEKEVVIELIKNYFIPLFGSVTVENRYKKAVGGIEGVVSTDIGIGAADTWYGSPDLTLLYHHYGTPARRWKF